MSTKWLRLGSQLIVRDNWSVHTVFVDEVGNTVVGIHSDKMRMHITDWSFDKVVEVLNAAQEAADTNQYVAGRKSAILEFGERLKALEARVLPK